MSVAAPEQTTPEMTYTVADMTPDIWSWVQTECNVVDGKAEITFNALNDDIAFKLPTTLDLSKVESIVYHFEEQSAPMNLFILTDTTSFTKIDSYGNIGATSYTFEITDKTEKVDYIGVQLGAREVTQPESAVFLGITINMKPGFSIDDVASKTINAGDCPWWDIYGNNIDKNNTPANEDGSVSSELTGQNKEFKFKLLPTGGVNLADYTKIVVDFESDKPVVVKVWPIAEQQKDAGSEDAPAGYNVSLMVAYGQTGTIEFDLTSESNYEAKYLADEAFDYKTFDIYQIAFMMLEADVTANVTFNSVTFK